VTQAIPTLYVVPVVLAGKASVAPLFPVGV
jgi:hypothetical protein